MVGLASSFLIWSRWCPIESPAEATATSTLGESKRCMPPRSPRMKQWSKALERFLHRDVSWCSTILIIATLTKSLTVLQRWFFTWEWPENILHNNRVHVPLDSYRPTWENRPNQKLIPQDCNRNALLCLSQPWSFWLAKSDCPLTRTKCRAIFRLKGHEHMQMTYVHAPSSAVSQDLHFQRALCSQIWKLLTINERAIND